MGAELLSTAGARRYRAWTASGVRRWPVWALPPAALLVVLATGAAALAALAASSITVGFGTVQDAVTFAVLTGCGLLCVEAMRRIGEAAGVYQDLMAVWTLPIALLLPAPYALLAPIPGRWWSQQRVSRTPLYRRVFSTAAIALAHLAANQAFHAVLPRPMALPGMGHAALLLGAAVLGGGVYVGVNSGLVASAIRLSSPEARWRELLADRDVLALSALEVCTGVAVAALVVQSPLLVIAAVPAAIVLQRSLTHAQLRTAARTDAKTGLLNAVAWQRELERDLARCAREGRPLSVLLLDLDHFKGINDSYGHLAGDQVLVAIADLLRSELRGIDLIGRFGGEEFVAGLATDAASAQLIAARLCRRIAAHTVENDGHLVSVTASIGVTTLTPGRTDSPTDILAAADAALYAAKAAGRNRTAHT